MGLVVLACCGGAPFVAQPRRRHGLKRPSCSGPVGAWAPASSSNGTASSRAPSPEPKQTKQQAAADLEYSPVHQLEGVFIVHQAQQRAHTLLQALHQRAALLQVCGAAAGTQHARQLHCKHQALRREGHGLDGEGRRGEVMMDVGLLIVQQQPTGKR